MDNFKSWELNTELRKFLETCLRQQWKRSKIVAVLKKISAVIAGQNEL